MATGVGRSVGDGVAGSGVAVGTSVAVGAAVETLMLGTPADGAVVGDADGAATEGEHAPRNRAAKRRRLTSGVTRGRAEWFSR